MEALSGGAEKTRDYLYKATGREFDIPENVAHSSDIIYKFRDEIAERNQKLVLLIN